MPYIMYNLRLTRNPTDARDPRSEEQRQYEYTGSYVLGVKASRTVQYDTLQYITRQ